MIRTMSHMLTKYLSNGRLPRCLQVYNKYYILRTLIIGKANSIQSIRAFKNFVFKILTCRLLTSRNIQVRVMYGALEWYCLRFGVLDTNHLKIPQMNRYDYMLWPPCKNNYTRQNYLCILFFNISVCALLILGIGSLLLLAVQEISMK